MYIPKNTVYTPPNYNSTIKAPHSKVRVEPLLRPFNISKQGEYINGHKVKKTLEQF